MLALAAFVVLLPTLVLGALVDAFFPKLGFNLRPETPFRPRLIHFMGLIFPLIGVGFFLDLSISGQRPWDAAIPMGFDVAFVLAVLGLGIGRRLPPFVWLLWAFFLAMLFIALLYGIVITLLIIELHRSGF
jgi:hypothetical protein